MICQHEGQAQELQHDWVQLKPAGSALPSNTTSTNNSPKVEIRTNSMMCSVTKTRAKIMPLGATSIPTLKIPRDYIVYCFNQANTSLI